MNKPFGIVLIALVFASCQNSGDRKTTTTAPAAPTTFSAPLVLDSNKGSITTNTPSTSTSNGATGALNPAHGAPGHRCEIPVGAPLNTPASNGTAAPATNINPMPITLPTPTQTQPANNNSRLNPAHGAPGHDCSIPVGQPLKS